MTWRKGAFALGTRHAIRWSGRAQRDSVMQGEFTISNARRDHTTSIRRQREWKEAL